MKKLEENPLLSKLLKSGASDSVTFLGYIGHVDENYINFYQDIFNLSNWLVINTIDVIHYEEAPKSLLPFGGVILWLNKDSKVKFKSVHDKSEKELKSSDVGIPANRLELIVGQGDSIVSIKKHICNPK
jgi:hypothetical protein